jgi:hypothetical protein
VLHVNGQDTVRISVGDNLLSKGWVADILRLNKCFVVQRSEEGRREKLTATKLLSENIYCSLTTAECMCISANSSIINLEMQKRFRLLLIKKS